MGLTRKTVLEPNAVLAAILMVDGDNSDLDADLLDGKHLSEIKAEINIMISDSISSAILDAIGGDY